MAVVGVAKDGKVEEWTELRGGSCTFRRTSPSIAPRRGSLDTNIV
jgi:hypothetical protein